MNYEEAYKEAIERCKSWMRGEHPECFTEAQKAGEYIFPELRESEDEKIIRTLKEIVNWGCAKNISVENNVELKDCLAWIEKQGEQKPTNKIEQSCYHNDGLYYAIDILEKTLGKVEGYQSDDGKMEHQIAIETVNALYHKNPTEWSEEDEKRVNSIISSIEYCSEQYPDRKEYVKDIDWLKSLKPNHWKPSDEQMEALKDIIIGKRGPLYDLYFDLKKL